MVLNEKFNCPVNESQHIIKVYQTVMNEKP